MKCKRGREMKICNCAAGYYIGTFDEDGPVCRMSIYYRTREELERALDSGKIVQRDAPENAFMCGSGSSLRDSGIRKIARVTWAYCERKSYSMDYDALEILIDDYCFHDCSDGRDDVCSKCHIRLFLDKLSAKGSAEAVEQTNHFGN